MTEDEHRIGYKVLKKGTPVEASDGTQVGTVHRVLDNLREHIFDGIVITTGEGKRFVDAPEVRRIDNGEVELAVTRSDVWHPGPKGPPGPRDVHGIRLERDDVTDEDRDAVAALLKVAYVEDRFDVEELERRVDVAHRATRLSDLDAVVADLI